MQSKPLYHLEYKVSKVDKSSDAAESHDESETKSSLDLENVVRKGFTCYICKSEYDTNEKWQKLINENHKDVVKGEEFVCEHCRNNCSNLKAHKKECKYGIVDKLPLLYMNVIQCKFSNRFNLHQHLASSPCCRTGIEQLQKAKSYMASDKKAQKTDSVSDSSKSATRNNNGTGKQNLHLAEQLKLKRLKGILSVSQKLRVQN